LVCGVEAVGLDETLFARRGRRRHRQWCTSIVGVQKGQLLDVVAGRDASAPKAWLLSKPEEWRENVAWGVLDLSGAYRAAFDGALVGAGQVADPFHVIRLADDGIDEVRRRSPNGTLGHRGCEDDPLFRIRRRLLARIRALLYAGKPNRALPATITPR
jgi:transposase